MGFKGGMERCNWCIEMSLLAQLAGGLAGKRAAALNRGFRIQGLKFTCLVPAVDAVSFLASAFCMVSSPGGLCQASVAACAFAVQHGGGADVAAAPWVAFALIGSFPALLSGSNPRGGRPGIKFRSPQQEHSFGFPYQLGHQARAWQHTTSLAAQLNFTSDATRHFPLLCAARTPTECASVTGTAQRQKTCSGS